jgi:lipopolysaccharide export system permease protein
LNLLDRHLFKGVLFTCAAAVGLFMFVLVLGNAIKDLLTPVVTGQLGWAMVAKLIIRLLPAVAPFALPIGMLTGILLTLGRLSADSEITAMRAAGISLFRLSRPIFLVGILGTVASLYANFEWMPRNRVFYETQLAAALRANPMSFIVPKTFIRQFRGMVVYLGERQGTVVHDVWLWKLDNQGRVREFIRAETGRIEFDEKAETLLLTLTPAQIEQRDNANPEDFSKSPKSATSGVIHFDPIPLERLFGRNSLRIKDDWLTYGELNAKRAKLYSTPLPVDNPKAAEVTRMKLELVVQNKFNLALAVFSFAMIGVPLGIKVSRRETSANLGLAVLLALSYYTLTIMIGWLDRHPEYRPDLLLWAPNLIFIALGVWLFRRIER